jgi:hypothetical protein
MSKQNIKVEKSIEIVNNEQILSDIQKLQEIERSLFNNLEKIGLTEQQQKQIVEKINNISTMRINLYKTLNSVNTQMGGALQSSNYTLKDQKVAVGIVESELNKSKKRLELLEEQKNNKIRLIQINDYYGQRYAEHTELMKIFIFMLVPIIILAVLYNKRFLPSKVYYILIIIIAIIGSFWIANRFISIMSRDNMNYQNYNWYFNTGDAKESNSASSEDPWFTTNVNIGTCIGEMCCADGLKYDNTINQCIAPVESFMAGLTLNQKPDVVLGSELVEPNITPSFINFNV